MRNSLAGFGLAGFLALAVLPVIAGLLYAGAYSLGLSGLLSKGFTAAYLSELLTGGEIWLSLGVSMYIALVAVALSALCGGSLALSLGKASSTPLYLPLVLPAAVAAFFVFQLLADAGLLARLCRWLGLIRQPGDLPALVHDTFGIGIVSAHMLTAVPFFALLYRHIYQHEKLAELWRLTQTLGGTRVGYLRRVLLPVFLQKSRPQLLLYFIAVMGAYEIPLLLGRQSPQMISVLTMRKYQMFDLQQKPVAYIAALLYTLVVMVLLAAGLGGMRRSVPGGGRVR